MEQNTNREQNGKKVLRAHDIIPSSNTGPNQDNSLQSPAAEMTQTAVPRFDLAAEIMAQQRKITAARRKKTDGRVQTAQEGVKIKSPDASIRPGPPRIPAQYSVIAEIVARDIQIMLQTYGKQQAQTLL